MNANLIEQLTKAITMRNLDHLSQLSFDVCYDQKIKEKAVTLALIDACIGVVSCDIKKSENLKELTVVHSHKPVVMKIGRPTHRPNYMV